MRTNSLASCWAAVCCWLAAAAVCVERVVEVLSRPLPSAVNGTTAAASVVLGALLAFSVAPCWAIDLPPGRMLPENAALSACCRTWYLEMLTEEIENSTMNSAISSVIMSA